MSSNKLPHEFVTQVDEFKKRVDTSDALVAKLLDNQAKFEAALEKISRGNPTFQSVTFASEVQDIDKPVFHGMKLTGTTAAVVVTNVHHGGPPSSMTFHDGSDVVGLAIDGGGHLRLQNNSFTGTDDGVFLSNKEKPAVFIVQSSGLNGVRIDGTGHIVLRNKKGTSIELDGEKGDIVLSNADCAEEFDVLEPDEAEPGTVMTLDDGERVRVSRVPYDKCVAGVVSGAGAFRPGLVLDRRGVTPSRRPLALLGKVFCKVDADFGSIEVGDLLTTSGTPGYAMKASDPTRAFGAVLGKALRSLPSGHGLIPILVALQ